MSRRRTVALASAASLLVLSVLVVLVVVVGTQQVPGQDWVRRTIAVLLAASLLAIAHPRVRSRAGDHTSGVRWSIAALLGVGLAVLLLVEVRLQTGTGRDWVRQTLVAQLKERVQGRLYIGAIRGGLLSGVTIDSLEIRDADDSLFVSTGRIRATYDPRDLFDRRVLIRHLEVEHPVIRIAQADSVEWNWRRIFPRTPSTGPRSQRGFGDFLVADSLSIRDGSIILTLPWHPADSLRGARRDSAVAANIARKDAEVRRRGDGTLTRTWRWSDANWESGYVRFAQPDSIGRYFDVRRLDLRGHAPPLAITNAAGRFRWLGDSIWLDLDHFDLPGSTGSATGKVVWGSDKPIRYDVRITGDSVSMADVAWVYPTLPTTGGGSMNLRIRNDPANLSVIDYALTRMDVRSTRSHLTGAMTYGVGGPVLVVKDVALAAAPLDFALIRALNGKPFPYDWRGTITGTVRARGGRLDRFTVDDARFTFADANVPGAVTRASARGGLDILFPAFTKFRGLDVTVARADLRTVQFLNPNFPRLGGLVAGRATLDSSWLDVRFRNADVTHTDGSAEPSRFTGAGRVTYGEQFMSYDLALDAAPLSLTTLARSYPMLPLRGTLTGPLRVQGDIEDLTVTTTLTGAAGTLAFDGRLDAYTPGFAVRGAGTVAGLDLRTLFASTPTGAASLRQAPTSALNARFTTDVAGDALADLRGTLALDVDRSVVDSVRVYGGRMRLAFDGGRVRVDTLDVESAALRLTATGRLGLDARGTDTLYVTATADSLGGLRRYLSTAAAATPADSLGGTLALNALLVGSVDTSAASPGLRLTARVNGRELLFGATRAHAFAAGATFEDLLRAPHGSATFGLDTLVVAGVRLTRTDASFSLDQARAGQFKLRAGSDTGPTVTMAGRTGRVGDTTLVHLDSATLAAGSATRYQLASPALLRLDAATGGRQLDSLVLRGTGGATIAFGGLLRGEGPVSAFALLQNVPLADVGRIAGVPVALVGQVSFDARMSGTASAPIMQLRAGIADPRVGNVQLDRVDVQGSYAGRVLQAQLELFRDGARALTADARLPLDLALGATDRRLMDDSLTGLLHTEGVDLGLLEALVPGVQRAAGRLQADVRLGGTWRRPQLSGGMQVTGGAATLADAGVRVEGVSADVALVGDSVAIRRFVARSGGAGDTAALTGHVLLTSLDNPTFDLRLYARDFLAVDRARVATLELSTPVPLTLVGPYRNAVLRGTVRAERGRIYIPELIDKRVVDLSEYRDVVDTSLSVNRRLLPAAPSAFVENLNVENLTVQVGSDVWLRSPETNIKLGGALDVDRAVAREFGGTQAQLALKGTLEVEKGTYRLNLGIAQPLFDVQPGELRFFGGPDLNPTLAIRAVHTVRQPQQRSGNRPDVQVQVAIGGTLARPTLTLESAENPPISQTDLLSYLVTGEPAYAVFGTQGTEQGATLALRLAGSYLSGLLTGGPFDIVQVETGGVTDVSADNLRQSGLGVLERTRVGLGGQLGENTYYRFSTGLCGLNPSSEAAALTQLRRGLGFKVERRLGPGLSLEVGLEPGSQAQACGREETSRAFQQTPTQYGFDLFRAWQF
jgi:translocation and assembly module TamB